MVVLSELEVQCNNYFETANKYLKVGDYNTALNTIEKAIALCKKIYNSTLDIEKKSFWRKNEEQCITIRDLCCNKLGIKQNTPIKNVQKQSPVVSQKKEKQNDIVEDESEQKDNNDIDESLFIVNEIDVRRFFEKDANSNVTFNDVCGMKEEKELIEDEFFLSEEDLEINKYYGIEEMTALLLYGVPGTGKTYFAKAISNEFKKRMAGENVHFFAVKSSLICDSYVGKTEKNIQAIFDFAAQFDRCVLFIDEIEHLVTSRTIKTGNPIAGSMISVFLQAMDGFSSSKNTLVIAATNVPDQIDTAILSRFKTKILVPLPDKELILQILERNLKQFIDSENNFDNVAEKLIGYSNREISQFINELKKVWSKAKKNKKQDLNNELINKKDQIDDKVVDQIIKKLKKTSPADILRIEAFKSL